MLQLFEEANKKTDLVRYKIDKKVNTGGWTGARKVALMLQLAMSGGSLENHQLRLEMPQICDNAARVPVCQVCVASAARNPRGSLPCSVKPADDREFAGVRGAG